MTRDTDTHTTRPTSTSDESTVPSRDDTRPTAGASGAETNAAADASAFAEVRRRE